MPGTSEGVHTLKVSQPNDSSGLSKDVVLAFEAADDATRYALLLEAQDFPTPTVEEIDRSEIEEFCQSAGSGTSVCSCRIFRNTTRDKPCWSRLAT